jgi:hypothetical protein
MFFAMPAKIDLESIVVVVPDQVSADLGREAVVLGLDRGVYYGLDELGSRIWELIAEPRTVAELRDAILAEYEVETDVCERDLVEFLGRLAGEGLIEVKVAGA